MAHGRDHNRLALGLLSLLGLRKWTVPRNLVAQGHQREMERKHHLHIVTARMKVHLVFARGYETWTSNV